VFYALIAETRAVECGVDHFSEEKQALSTRL
jgi:hypothetical protein